MGTVIKSNLPCLNPDCKSSDALQVFEKGDSFCFSCNSFFSKEQTEKAFKVNVASITVPSKQYSGRITIEEIQTFRHKGLEDRFISEDVCKFFDVRVSFDENGHIDAHYYPYDKMSYKVRKVENKEFYWLGAKTKKLFGQDKFQTGGRRVVIVEGEIDAMSVAQAWKQKYNKIYPVVSISSATGTKALIDQREWLRSFEEIVICFDEDEPGKKAQEEAIHILGMDKVKITKLPHKDANEVLQKDGFKKIIECIFDASRYIPSGIISKEELWEALVQYNSIPAHPYPPCLNGLNDKLKGMRQGEISTFISGTGSGKSTMMREVIMHLLSTTDSKIGVVSLEESPPETARKLCGMALNVNPAEVDISLEEMRIGFDSVFGSDRIILLDHQGAIDDSSILDKLEYMALTGANYIIIDHITILVSEGVQDLQGNEAQDKMMGDLLRFVKRRPVWIGLVSHLRKAATGGKSFEEGRMPSTDDIKGSGSIKQISFDIIAFTRNTVALSELEKNTIKIRVLKCRQTGKTGDVNGAYYNYSTGRLSALNFAVEEFVTV
jgi:twinkle protein